MTESLYSIKTILVNRKETVSVAESVTAGDIQSAFSLCEKALQFFEGGITVYTVEQKIRHLQVTADHAIACNGVSQQVASEMATSVAKLFKTDWGIAITGYASPVPEENITDLFAWAGFSYQGNLIITAKIDAPRADALQVRWLYKTDVLQRFLSILTQ